MFVQSVEKGGIYSPDSKRRKIKNGPTKKETFEVGF
jgi:hypothetical protein